MLEDFSKQKLLGSGSFGEAWLVKNISTSRRYVLKQVKLLGLDEKERVRALTEAITLSKCNHYNIIRYKNSFIQDLKLHIIMDYAEGGDLQHRVNEQKGKQFEKSVILNWFIQVAFALRYIHSQHIIHRDLKPQNIFLNGKGIVKVGDFGIARILKNTLDVAMTSIGTPLYLSPELCAQKPYNSKSDMWSLGCVLYELCCLSPPFPASVFSNLVMQISAAKYTPMTSYNVNDVLQIDLVEALLKIDPTKRPSAAEILHIPKLQPYIDNYVKDALTGSSQSRRPDSASSSRRGSNGVACDSPSSSSLKADGHRPARKASRSLSPQVVQKSKQEKSEKEGLLLKKKGVLEEITNVTPPNQPMKSKKRADTPRPKEDQPKLLTMIDIDKEDIDPNNPCVEIPKKINSDSKLQQEQVQMPSPSTMLPLRVEAVKRKASYLNSLSPIQSPEMLPLSPMPTREMLTLSHSDSSSTSPRSISLQPMSPPLITLSTPQRGSHSCHSPHQPRSPKRVNTETYTFQGSPTLAWKINRFIYESTCLSYDKMSDPIKNLERRLTYDLGRDELKRVTSLMSRYIEKGKPYMEAIQGLDQKTLDLLPCVLQMIQLRHWKGKQ